MSGDNPKFVIFRNEDRETIRKQLEDGTLLPTQVILGYAKGSALAGHSHASGLRMIHEGKVRTAAVLNEYGPEQIHRKAPESLPEATPGLGTLQKAREGLEAIFFSGLIEAFASKLKELGENPKELARTVQIPSPDVPEAISSVHTGRTGAATMQMTAQLEKMKEALRAMGMDPEAIMAGSKPETVKPSPVLPPPVKKVKGVRQPSA